MKSLPSYFRTHRWTFLIGFCILMLMIWWQRRNQPNRLFETQPGLILSLRDGRLLTNQGTPGLLDIVSIDLATGAKHHLWHEPDPLINVPPTFDISANNQIFKEENALYYLVNRIPPQIAQTVNKWVPIQAAPLMLRRFDIHTNRAEDVFPVAPEAIYVDSNDASIKAAAPAMRIINHTAYWLTAYPDAALMPRHMQIPRSYYASLRNRDYHLVCRPLNGSPTRIIATGLTPAYSNFYVQHTPQGDRIYWTTVNGKRDQARFHTKFWTKAMPDGPTLLLPTEIDGAYPPMLQGTELGLYVFNFAHLTPCPLDATYFGVSDKGIPVSTRITLFTPSAPFAPSLPHDLSALITPLVAFGNRIYFVQQTTEQDRGNRNAALISMKPDGSAPRELPLPRKGIVSAVSLLNTYKGNLYLIAIFKPSKNAEKGDSFLFRLTSGPEEHLEEVCQSPDGLFAMDNGYGYYFEPPKRPSWLPWIQDESAHKSVNLWTNYQTLCRVRLPVH